MDYINLKGITITDQIMGIIQNYIDVRCLVVGEWTLAIEMNLTCNKLDELGIANNNHVELRLLTHKSFSNLAYLTLEDCPKLRMRYLCDFVKCNEVLKQLIIEDCTQIDSNCRIGEIIECVWSRHCRLETFHYIFSKESVFRVLGYHHEPTPEHNVHIKYVNFNNNTYIGHHIPEVLRKSPNLRSLEILNIRKEFGLDFGYTRHTLHMNYDDYFHAALCSLEDNSMRAFLVVKKKGRCKTRPLNLISIFEILEITDNFIFE